MRIQARKVWENSSIVLDITNDGQFFDSAMLTNNPKTAWIVKDKSYPFYDGASWEPTFQQPPNDINVVKGVWLEYGKTACLIDGSIDDVVSKFGACCGDDAVVTPNYPDGMPAYQAPVALSFTLLRTDDGSVAASAQAVLDYSGNGEFKGNVLPGTFTKVSATSGVTTYTFKAYSMPAPQGSDSITETALVFQSNTAPSLSGSNVFQLQGVADGDSFNFKGTTALSSTVTALQADAVLGTYGTWSTASSKIVLTTTAKQEVTLLLGQEAP